MITEITQGAARARLAPHLGGRLTSLRLAPAGRAAVELLLPFPEDTTDLLHWPKGGIYPLMPYSGRIRDAAIRTEAGIVALRPHPDAAPHTLHGHAHRQRWRLRDGATSAAGMAYDHPGDDEWPWPFSASFGVALLAPDQCEITLCMENTGTARALAGLGLHPFFQAAGDSRLRLTAGREWPLDEAGLTAADPVAGVVWDGPVKGSVTRQFSDWDGKAVLATPQGTLTLSASQTFGHLVLHRPADVAWLCLEPVSHVVDGFNLAARGATGTGAQLLDPGERIEASLTITVA